MIQSIIFVHISPKFALVSDLSLYIFYHKRTYVCNNYFIHILKESLKGKPRGITWYYMLILV